MKEQLKRILAAAAVCCTLTGATLAPAAGAPVSAAGNMSAAAGTVSAAAVKYTDSASFAERVQSIIEGNCGVYADSALTVPVSLPVGSALNTWQTYFVDAGGAGWSGMQCYIYAQGVYSVLFGVMPGNGGTNTSRVQTVLSGVQEITAETLYSHQVMPGAYLRTTANADLSFNGSAGHSMILLGYTETTVTVLEGNADGFGAIELNTFTYPAFNDRFTTGKSRGVSQVIQPDASVYAAEYGIYFSGGNGMLPLAVSKEDSSAPAVTSVLKNAAAPTVTTAKTTLSAATTPAETTTAEVTTVTTTSEATTAEATTAATTAETTAAATAEPAGFTKVCTDMIIESELDAPIFLPVEDAEQYEWSTDNPEVAVLIWDGIVFTRQYGTAVISAVRGNERFDFEICVDAVNWESLGDVNEDGCTDPMDALLVMNVYMNQAMRQRCEEQPQIALALADVDGSGGVDLVDAQLILKYYVNTALVNSSMTAREAWNATLSLQNK